MTAVITFLAGLSITCVVSLAVVRFLRPSLHRILVDLCGSEDRAGFWTAFSAVTLVLVPIIGAMLRRPEIASDADALFELSAQLELAFLGLVGATLAIGFVISRFIPRPVRGGANTASRIDAASAPPAGSAQPAG